MPKTYLPCADHDQSVLDMADELMRRYYQDLLEADLKISFLFVSHDGVGPALTHGGYPAAAVVKANSLKDRVEGKADVTITIDKEWWEQHDTSQNLALLDHELYHVMIARDDDGKTILDDAGRPKVRMRPHDYQIGGFHDIAKRHRMKSVDMSAIQDVHVKFVQAHLFAGDDIQGAV